MRIPMLRCSFATIALPLVWACSGDDSTDGKTDPVTDGDADTDADADADADADSDSDSDADTDTAPDAVLTAATCTIQPSNALRFDCALTTSSAGTVHVRLLDGGVELGTWADATVSSSHTVTLWGMTPSSTYQFEAWADETPGTVLSGDLTTGALPPAVDVALPVTSTGSHDTRFVLFDWACGGVGAPEALLIARDDGQVVWYQLPDQISADDDNFYGFSLTPEGTILALLERTRAVEWDLGGNLLLNLTLDGGGLTHYTHHAIERVNGLTYAMTAVGIVYPDGNNYAMDGFDVIDGEAGVIASWSSEGLFDPQLVGPALGSYWGNQLGIGASDWSHANAIGLSPTNDVYVSMRYLDAIIKVVGDPADPAFGTVEWVMLGGDSPGIPYDNDFTLLSTTGVAPVNFGQQHHVSVDPQGDLLMWDNRYDPTSNSRGLRVHVDETAMTADLVEAWDSGSWCPGRGSAFELPSGNLLGDCSPENTVVELADQTSEIVWSLEATCVNGTVPDHMLYRAIPLDPYPHD
ncbi:MAG: aryl-sulfate sulfotransferase [Myxococcota bacterium]